MKAYVFAEKGVLTPRELPAPSLAAEGEAGKRGAILRPRFLSPCSSDVHTVFAGNGPRRENLVLGHEGLAEVLEVGEDVRDFQPGDLVAVSAIMPDAPDGTGHEGAPFSGAKLGRNINGMWSERFFVPAADQNLAHIPAGLSPEAALMACDMMQTGFTAAEGADIRLGQSVAVLGTGAVGLMAIAAAKHLGAGRVIAVGSSKRPACTELAAAYGADIVLAYQDGSLLWQRETDGVCLAAMERFEALRSPLSNFRRAAFVTACLNLTENQGVDRVLVCGGGGGALAEACDILRYGSGIAVSVEYLEGSGEVGLPIFSLGRGMAGKTFRFLLSKGGRKHLESMLALAASGEVDAGQMVTHRLSGFDSIPEALRLMRERPNGLIKMMIAL